MLLYCLSLSQHCNALRSRKVRFVGVAVVIPHDGNSRVIHVEEKQTKIDKS